LIVALIIGAMTGWLMSMPIGPINAAVISRTIKYSARFGVAVAIGAGIMDVIYCGGAAQINEFLVESPVINLFFEFAGFSALLILGIRQLTAKTVAHDPSSTDTLRDNPDRSERVADAAIHRMHLEKKSLLGPFTIGILLYATNVMAVPEWIIVSGLWRSWGLLGSGFDINASFALGAGAGTIGWYLVLIRWISKRRRGFKPATLQKINLGTSIAMLAFAAYFAYAILFETHWGEVQSHFIHNTGSIIDSIRAK
jgi:threonine/homoserine/homoserine lactone efflux protein